MRELILMMKSEMLEKHQIGVQAVEAFEFKDNSDKWSRGEGSKNYCPTYQSGKSGVYKEIVQD